MENNKIEGEMRWKNFGWVNATQFNWDEQLIRSN